MSVIVRNPVIVAFDFDGTLTRGESFFRFLAHVTPWHRFIFCLLLSLPVLIGYGLGRIENDDAKARVIRRFLRGRRVDQLARQAEDFAQHWIPHQLRPEAVARLRGHQKQGHVCVLVSATLALYLQPWARDMGFDRVLATELTVDATGSLTGEMSSPNCFGPEKARRLRDAFACERIHAAYGDTAGDREMLAMADKPGYRLWH